MWGAPVRVRARAGARGAARELDVQEVKDISLWAIDRLLPDLTVLLDLPAQEAMNRREATRELSLTGSSASRSNSLSAQETNT